ncbi:hypothetical protein HK097_000118, partial [Rhizophlyctis rosea]
MGQSLNRALKVSPSDSTTHPPNDQHSAAKDKPRPEQARIPKLRKRVVNELAVTVQEIWTLHAYYERVFQPELTPVKRFLTRKEFLGVFPGGVLVAEVDWVKALSKLSDRAGREEKVQFLFRVYAGSSKHITKPDLHRILRSSLQAVSTTVPLPRSRYIIRSTSHTGRNPSTSSPHTTSQTSTLTLPRPHSSPHSANPLPLSDTNPTTSTTTTSSLGIGNTSAQHLLPPGVASPTMGMTPRASTVASAGQLDFIVGAIVEQTFGEVDRNEDGVIDEREFGEACEERPELLRGMEFAEG